MKPSRNDDDEPDVIDLTTFYGNHRPVPYHIRPPSPFADAPPTPEPLHRDHEFNAVMTWSEPVKPHSLSYRINNTEQPTFSSSCNSPPPRPSAPTNGSRWWRTLNKLLKRAKSSERKDGDFTSTRRSGQQYGYEGDEKYGSTVVTVRPTNHKRVHWFDEEQARRHECCQFLDSLKLATHAVLDGDSADYYLERCQRSLHQLTFLVNYEQLERAFGEFVERAQQNERGGVVQQQKYIESLLCHVRFSSN